MENPMELRDVAAAFVPHIDMRLTYIRGIQMNADQHLDTARMILSERLSQIVEGDHRPLDIVDLVDATMQAAAHFAAAKQTTWALPGPSRFRMGGRTTMAVPFGIPVVGRARASWWRWLTGRGE